MNPGEIGSRPEHSNLLNVATECRMSPADDGWLRGPSTFEGSNTDAVKLCDRMQARARRKIETAVTYMLQHLDQPLEMASVSKWTGIAPSTFYCLFKRATGYTPNDFLIRARIQRACELFRESDLNVKEVAALLGYQDQFYFSRLFKSVTGVPPRDYRTMRLETEYARTKAALMTSEAADFELPRNRFVEKTSPYLEKSPCKT